MIDKLSRRKAAEAIRHFIAGRITNDQFIDRYPFSKTDPVVWALDDTLYAFYDDVRTHRLTEEFSISEETKRTAARWVMFLYSDYEYEWPRISVPGLRDNFRPSLFGRLTGLANLRLWRDRRFREHGDYDVWPFFRRVDFEEALKKPFLLRGNL